MTTFVARVVFVAVPSIAFDWGGVLVTDGSREAWPVLEHELGIPADEASAMWYQDLQQHADLGEIGEAEIWSALARCRPGARVADIRRIFLEQYREMSYGVGVLRAAKAASWEVILATNNVRSWLDWWAGRYRWFDCIDLICCSSDIGARKPDGSYYAYLQGLVSDPHAYFVDDRQQNTDAADRHGFRAILADDEGLWRAPNGLLDPTH